ncbi:hypothetical protein P691DRAFT_778102 [Macrolepiota fuliginosa MF-IS2]|uniref:Uncharacterized protein n=1 Tax=Macrolepiota fuliginosa MF-IS2 TaxID=1400762 RepID=A0A9P5X4Y9_9AGAR|nr:hypothetical protein P691DRAFT_778102 [Macrolepiota fuliginosa MF-IS2]
MNDDLILFISYIPSTTNTEPTCLLEPIEMGASDIGVAAASFGIAVVALVGATLQLMISVNIEARRKGKRDKLALGEWAISNPELKLFFHNLCHFFRLSSPWGDPRLTVPFITVGEMEKYLKAEAKAHKRPTLARRIPSRLVTGASLAIMSGGGRYSGRMYAVRETTRKRCEACWSDAMDMCGMKRDFWSLLTAASAQACDGQVRPANAVTNLHSLCGFGRIMGLRQVTYTNNRITMTNGGASLYLDLHANVDRPTRLAHFSGSPNGRYLIVEEMSQHTAQSVYADAVWAAGNVPDEARLSPLPRGPTPKFSSKTLSVPTHLPRLHRASRSPSLETWGPDLEAWAREVVTVLNNSRVGDDGVVDLLDLIHTPVIISCIRTYPVSELTPQHRSACHVALRWCIQYWYLCPFQSTALRLQPTVSASRPRLPLVGTGVIWAEFITGSEQSNEWYQMAHAASHSSETVTLVDDHSWSHILDFVNSDPDNPSDRSTLPTQVHIVLTKILQIWKIFLIEESGVLSSSIQYQHPRSAGSQEETEAVLAALTMACLAIATDSNAVGDGEANKAVEIEFG